MAFVLFVCILSQRDLTHHRVHVTLPETGHVAFLQRVVGFKVEEWVSLYVLCVFLV